MTIKNISGFPELLPEQFALELRWRSTVQRVFEHFGFVPIETAAVERLDVLLGKGGDADKELYALTRAAGGGGEPSARLGLHYDLTVPLARYVATHANDLSFPFKRQQMQKAWRGERPQEGRYREFLQCDIDVIDRDTLAPDFESEVAAAMLVALAAIGVTRFNFAINDRRLLDQTYRSLGIEDPIPVIRVLDKIDKLSKTAIAEELVDRLGLSDAQAKSCIDVAAIRASDMSFVEALVGAGVAFADIEPAVTTLGDAMERLARHKHANTNLFVDLSVARGFDYYTGLVFEGRFQDYPTYPAICSGGRYDNLVGSMLSGKMPGVGGSIGLTRILMKVLKEEAQANPVAPNSADVLIARFEDAALPDLDAAAATLRARGLRVEIYHLPAKLKKQMQYAERKGIRFLLFPAGATEGGGCEVKDLTTGTQVAIDIEHWNPVTPRQP